MGHSVKYAKVSVKKRNNAILRFSTKLVEMTMPEEPSYATAIKLAEALKDVGYALEACYKGKKAGKGLEYALEMRICKDTVSHQLTRDGNAAEKQLPSLHTVQPWHRPLMQIIIKLHCVYTLLCEDGARTYSGMDDMR